TPGATAGLAWRLLASPAVRCTPGPFGAGPVEPVQCRGHAVDPDPAVVHALALVFRSAGAVVDLGDDGRVRAVGGQLKAPSVPPSGLGGAVWGGVRVAPARLRFPADAPVWLELDDVVVHLIVAVLGVVHPHREDVTDAGDHRVGRGPAQHSRAVDVELPAPVRQPPEDVPGRRLDPAGTPDRLVLIPCHSAPSYPRLGGRPRPACLFDVRAGPLSSPPAAVSCQQPVRAGRAETRQLATARSPVPGWVERPVMCRGSRAGP